MHKNLANGAIISADKLNHMENGISNNDTNKVTDNKDDTEQLNGVRVQPYNKLSDVTNLRNIVLQTDNVISYTAKGGIGESIQDFPIYSGFSSLPSGTQVYYSYDLVVKNADGGVHWFGWGSPWDAFISNKRITKDGINHFQGTTTIPDVNSKQWIHSTIDNSHATYQITNLMIVVGSIPVTHLPAPEDKVTDNKNGSIQVNGSSITPADDSKVVHDNKDGTEQLNGVGVQPYNKLSDVTNLRNIVLQTDNVPHYTAQGSAAEATNVFPLYSGFSSLPSGTQIYYSYDLVVTNADGGTQWLVWTSPWNGLVESGPITKDGIHHFQGTAIIPCVVNSNI